MTSPVVTALPTEPTHYQHHINGAATSGAATGRIERRSPAHDVPVSTYAEGTARCAEAAIAAARTAFDDGPWPRTGGAGREAVLRRAAVLIREHREALAWTECLESGKPITQSRAEMEWAAGIWDYAAALSRRLHGETTNTLGEGLLGMTLREPIGVCGLITPWNFPLLIISQKLPFALAAGCTAVVKPSEFTSGTTVQLAALLEEAGLPPGACNVVTGHGDPVGRTLAQSDDVDMISFTGSTRIGRSIVAASAGNLKKVSLELGGKNPQIIFADAEWEPVIDAIIHGCYFNMGECCNSGSRILVEDTIADPLIERLRDACGTITTGDPLDESVRIGPIIHATQQKKIVDAVAKARKEGAHVVRGGAPIEFGTGHYFDLTILDHVRPEMSVAGEEVFGPVLSVIRFRDEQEAVRIANGTTYGLSAGIWTASFDRAMRMARSVQAGTVWVNTFLDGAPELPFGGYRQSGLGRELGPHAVEEYTETKTVTMRLGQYTPKWIAAGS